MTFEKSDANAIGYFVTVTLILYFLAITFFIYLTPNPGLAMRLAFVALVFVLMYLAATFFYGNPFKVKHSSPYPDSLIHLLALIAAGSILVSIVEFILFEFNLDMNAIYLQAKPGFVNSWNIHLPIFALIFWGLNGIIVAYFYHSVTYELFEKRGRLMGVGTATALFILNYNAPLLSNYWQAWDMAFYGFVFAYSYSIKRNPLALISAYLLFEVPMWWCLLAPFGKGVFSIYFISRIVVSAIALLILIFISAKKKKVKDHENR